MNNRNTPDINLNLNVRGLTQSATLEINESSNRLKKEGKKIYKLGLGQSPFPVPQSVVNELKENAYQKDYLPVKGLHALRETIAGYYRKTQGLEHTFEDVLTGPGSKELMFLLQLVYYGDILIPTPSWVSYAPQAHIIGRHVRWINTHPEFSWKIIPEKLEELCHTDPNKPRIVILNYPSNPTGVTYTKDELKEIAMVARKYKLILLSDEIYGELNFKGEHISIARYYPEGTIISSGLSKWCGAGGWRLGTFTFPSGLRWLLNSMAVVASETFTSTSTPIQYAAVKAFEKEADIEEYLKYCRKILSILGNKITNMLKEAGVSVAQPEGGFYIFPDFSSFREKLFEKKIITSHGLCSVLLEETGVAALPGSSFGRPENELTMRLAYVDFDGTRIMNAVHNMNGNENIDDNFINVYCENVITAVSLICNWIKT
ncbi:MAG: aminotransferase class I/II-fold pyridoxal phosphate-dependent enzyme [Ignavibacteriaceae bacterium]